MSKPEYSMVIWDKSKRESANCLDGIRYEGGILLIWAFVGNVGKLCFDVKGEIQVVLPRESEYQCKA
jgi:hypothetical protein